MKSLALVLALKGEREITRNHVIIVLLKKKNSRMYFAEKFTKSFGTLANFSLGLLIKKAFISVYRTPPLIKIFYKITME